jgi:prevent-host-death family protein
MDIILATRFPMSRQVSVADAKNHLPAILHEVEQGSPVEITRHGKPVAVILSMNDYRRLDGRRPDLVEALRDWRANAAITDEEIEEVFANTRDRSPGREIKW